MNHGHRVVDLTGLNVKIVNELETPVSFVCLLREGGKDQRVK